jgi:hypothetical protein
MLSFSVFTFVFAFVFGFPMRHYNSELVKSGLYGINLFFLGLGGASLILGCLLLLKKTFQNTFQSQSDRAELEKKLLSTCFVGAVTFTLIGISLQAIAGALP